MADQSNKKEVVAPGAWVGPYTTKDASKWKTVFWLETEFAIYKANTLDELLNLWRTQKDNSRVLQMGQVG